MLASTPARIAGHAANAIGAMLIVASVFLLAPPATGQQTYIGRYDVFGGYTYLDSRQIKLGENGFHFQSGMRVRSWLTLGFDYSISKGSTSLTPNLLTTALQQQLGAQLAQLAAAGEIPQGYMLSVPIDSTTQTFAAGPQVSWHGWEPATLFIRPSFGAIYENATTHPNTADPVAVAITAQLAPSGRKEDWTPFYGFGGGADFNVTTHLAVRVQADLVHDHLFSDLLKNGRNTVRFSIGPAWQFGRNVR